MTLSRSTRLCMFALLFAPWPNAAPGTNCRRWMRLIKDAIHHLEGLSKSYTNDAASIVITKSTFYVASHPVNARGRLEHSSTDAAQGAQGPPAKAKIFATACSAADISTPCGFPVGRDGIIDASTINCR